MRTILHYVNGPLRGDAWSLSILTTAGMSAVTRNPGLGTLTGVGTVLVLNGLLNWRTSRKAQT
jgi:hypothetical protein